MASSTIRKAIAAMKDQTSISLAKVAGTVAPDLEVLVVKATSHDNEPADEKYFGEILNMVAYSQGYVHACILAISKRLSKTGNWIVALKSLMLVHRLLSDGDPAFGQELMFASRRGARVLNISGFWDEAHSKSWDHLRFVRAYALYLDQRLEFIAYERKLVVGDGRNWKTSSYGDMNETIIPEKVLERLSQLILLLERFLGCRPTGAVMDAKMVVFALRLLVKDSFTLYVDISGLLDSLAECLSELDFACCVEAFDVYVDAAKIIDELVVFYSWCKDVRIAQSSEFPEVQKIREEVLGTLEGLFREKSRNGPKRAIETTEEEGNLSEIGEEIDQNLNEIKYLPPPSVYKHVLPAIPQPLLLNLVTKGDLMNLKDDGVSADQQGDKLALALFSNPGSSNTNDKWVEFDDAPTATSAWNHPAAEGDKPDWELELVESISQLSKQKADLGCGFDLLLLNGMYDQGTANQYVNSSQLSSGSASSVAFPVTAANWVLALPAPDGTVQPVAQQYPFAASASIPPPAYVQIADMRRKQQLLVQEQQLWQQ